MQFKLRLAAILFAFSIFARPEAFGAEVNFFPPSPAAAAVDTFDASGFVINGQRTFVASGSLHMPRVPRDLWRDRLLRIKRAGFNTVQTYVFWNYHEQKENTFDFTGEKDLGAFLSLAQAMGLYATVRVGPYVCAEWDSGGYPLWIRFKDDSRVRGNFPTYMDLQGKWLARVLPIVAAHQINKGGNVIFVQLENEGQFWGAWTQDKPNMDPYWQSLYQSALTNGIQVPFFMSGMHHGGDPFPKDPTSCPQSTDSSPTPLNPWFATEVWAAWFSIYGDQAGTNNGTLQFMSRALATGANGFNYYMVHGGTNFDNWGDSGNANYDYGAAIGQAGDERPIYYEMKKYNMFATSFADILENATDGTPDYKNFVTDGDVFGVRKSALGTIVFIESHSPDTPVKIQGDDGTIASLHVGNREIPGIVLNAPLIPAPANIRIIEAASQVVGVAHQGTTTTLILDGRPGDKGFLVLGLGDSRKRVDVSYPEGAPVQSFEKAGGQTLRILSMSSDVAPYTWIVGPKGHESVVVGPEYLGDFNDTEGGLKMTIERPFNHQAPNEVLIYGDADQPTALTVDSDSSKDADPAPSLTPWVVAPLAAEVQPNLNDSSWLASDDPTQMGGDGDISAYAWYRAHVQVPMAGAATIHFAGGLDHLRVFVNGQLVPATPSKQLTDFQNGEACDGSISWEATANLQAGVNTLAVFASHHGRQKYGGYVGAIKDRFPKGLFKPVTIQLGASSIPVKNWKLSGGMHFSPLLRTTPLSADYKPSVPAFFQATFNAKPPARTGPTPIYRFDTTGLSRGSIIVNGHNLGRYPDGVTVNDKPVPLYIPECWLSPSGRNTLLVFDEEGVPPTQAKLVVETTTSREVIEVSRPADPALSFTAPPFKPIDLK